MAVRGAGAEGHPGPAVHRASLLEVQIHEGGFAKWWSNFATNGYPWFVPYYVVSAEVFGALLLIPGIQTRLVSLYAVPMMLGAAHFWSVRKGFFFTVGGSELPLVWAVMLLVQALLGDGALAVGSGSFGAKM